MKNVVSFCLLCSATAITYGAYAQSITRTTDVTMDNFKWVPARGALEWLSNWELEAAVSAFDSSNGFASDYEAATHVPGTPTVVSSAVTTALGTVKARGEVNAAGILLSLNTSSAATVPVSVDYASTFSAATAYREFRITGGSGAVNVRFSFDYMAHLTATDDPAIPPSLVDYTATMRVSDGIKTWEINNFERKVAPTDFTFLGTGDDTFTLNFNTLYSVTYIKDNEAGSTPEPEAAAVAAGLGLLGFAWYARKGRALRSSAPFSTLRR